MDLPQCCQCVTKNHKQISITATNSKSFFFFCSFFFLCKQINHFKRKLKSSQGCECSSDHSGHGQVQHLLWAKQTTKRLLIVKVTHLETPLFLHSVLQSHHIYIFVVFFKGEKNYKIMQLPLFVSQSQMVLLTWLFSCWSRFTLEVRPVFWAGVGDFFCC